MSKTKVSKAAPVQDANAPKVDRITELVNLSAIAHINATDSQDARKRHWEAGKVHFEALVEQRQSIRRTTSSGETVDGFKAEDVNTYFTLVKARVRMLNGDSTARPDDSLRYYLFVETAREITGDAASYMPFGTVVNALIREDGSKGCVAVFNKAELRVEVRAEYSVLYGEIVRSLSSREPMSCDTARLAIKTRTAEIQGEKDKDDPAGAKARKEAEKRARIAKSRNDARDKIIAGLQTLVGDGLMEPASIMSLIESEVKAAGGTLPQFGADPTQMSSADCTVFAATMLRAGKFDEMRAMHKALGMMLDSVDGGTVQIKKTA